MHITFASMAYGQALAERSKLRPDIKAVSGTQEAPILVSACLVGLRCAYDGRHRQDPRVTELLRVGKVIPICPEQLGGLPTPRQPAELQGGDGEAVLTGRARVCTAAGVDLTEAFLRGAAETAHLAEAAGVQQAILRAGSPSCGVGSVHDGTFSGHRVPGDGVTAAALRRIGLRLEAI